MRSTQKLIQTERTPLLTKPGHAVKASSPKLPPEIWLEILSYLDFKSLARVNQVSCTMRQLSNSVKCVLYTHRSDEDELAEIKRFLDGLETDGTNTEPLSESEWCPEIYSFAEISKKLNREQFLKNEQRKYLMLKKQLQHLQVQIEAQIDNRVPQTVAGGGQIIAIAVTAIMLAEHVPHLTALSVGGGLSGFFCLAGIFVAGRNFCLISQYKEVQALITKSFSPTLFNELKQLPTIAEIPPTIQMRR